MIEREIVPLSSSSSGGLSSSRSVSNSGTLKYVVMGAGGVGKSMCSNFKSN